MGCTNNLEVFQREYADLEKAAMQDHTMTLDEYREFLHKLFSAYLADCGITDAEWEIQVEQLEDDPDSFNVSMVTDDPRVALAFNQIKLPE